MTARVEELRKQAFELPPAEQYRLAFFIAENVGYVLAKECTCGGEAGQPASHHDISCPAALTSA